MDLAQKHAFSVAQGHDQKFHDDGKIAVQNTPWTAHSQGTRITGDLSKDAHEKA